jgi:hypothetical protein
MWLPSRDQMSYSAWTISVKPSMTSLCVYDNRMLGSLSCIKILLQEIQL